MEIIQNDVWNFFCPLCKKDSIFRLGKINSDNPTYYSTNHIKLSKVPELWKCKDCGSSFVQNMVSLEDSIRLYSQGSSEEIWTKEPFEKSRTLTTIKKIDSLISSGMRVLDFGCGSGNFLDFIKSKGCITSGVEYSYSSLDQVIQNGHAGFSKLDDVHGTFDIITAFDVIEHLYDVPSFLETCKQKLAPNGHIILLTGNISSLQSKISSSKWWYAKFPDHIVFPSINYFKKYSGLEIVNWINVYHAPYAQNNFLIAAIKVLIKFIQEGVYIGHPSLAPDHLLIILKHHKMT
jgi:2-polyprenyl-3-methyl-5-hydroxy-6-metoxy-1,4-benzoquinol methylase